MAKSASRAAHVNMIARFKKTEKIQQWVIASTVLAIYCCTKHELFTDVFTAKGPQQDDRWTEPPTTCHTKIHLVGSSCRYKIFDMIEKGRFALLISLTLLIVLLLLLLLLKVKVPVYSLIAMLASMFSRLFTRWHGAATRAHPAHVDPTLDSCTRYPSLNCGQKHCRIRSLPKAPTHDQCWEFKSASLDLQYSALPTGPLDPILLERLTDEII